MFHILVISYSSYLSLTNLFHLACVCVCVCVRVHAKSLQSCLTLYESVDCSPPGSSVHGILLARIVEWVAMPSSRGDLPNPEIK